MSGRDPKLFLKFVLSSSRASLSVGEMRVLLARLLPILFAISTATADVCVDPTGGKYPSFATNPSFEFTIAPINYRRRFSFPPPHRVFMS